jgi:hypothetical protein
MAMKLAALVVVLSAMSLSDARAEDPSTKSQGNCMPIGLTASGEVVFPWDCRAIIEKQRGPVSVNVPSSSSDPSLKDQASEKAAQPPEQTAASAAAASVQPEVAVAAQPVQETTATAVHVAARVRPKRTLAAVNPADKKHQIAAQPQPASAITHALNALK